MWTIHESSGRKPDWEGVKSLLLRKYFKRELYITRTIGNKLMEQYFFANVMSSFVINTETKFAFFHNS